jgi:hypothetical protein
VRPRDGILLRARGLEDWFRKPFARIYLPPMLRGTKFVNGQAGDDSGQPRSYILNGSLVRLLQAEKGFLHNIFALNQASEITVGERQEARAFRG